LLRLPDGGLAIVMSSPSIARDEALLEGRSIASGAVRAHTIVSAYLLRPLPHGEEGVLLTSMSQTDLGGNIPAWVQSMAKKAGTQHFLRWVVKLQTHCASRMSQSMLVPIVKQPNLLEVESPREKAGSGSVSVQLTTFPKDCLERVGSLCNTKFTVQLTGYQLLLVVLVIYFSIDMLVRRFKPHLEVFNSGYA